MRKKCEVTIVCITYNQIGYIVKALDSMLAQETTFPFKILVHDDCSTDGTKDVLIRYAKEYPSKIDLILEERNQYSQGCSFVGKIVNKIEGQYVAVCEGDDYWTDSKKLQDQYDFLERNPEYVLVTHGAAVLDDRTGRISRKLCPADSDRDFETREIIESAGWLWAANSMFMRAEYYGLPEQFKGWGVADFPRSIYLSTEGRVRYFAREMSVYRLMAKGSWTEANEFDSVKKIASLKKRIAGLDRFNRYSHEKYSVSIGYVISKWRCEIAILERDWSKIKGDSLRRYYDSLGRKSKVSIWIRCHFPSLHKMLKSIFAN